MKNPGLATLMRNRRGNNFFAVERAMGVLGRGTRSSLEVPESLNGTFVFLLPFPIGLKTFIFSQRFIYILLAFAKNFNKTPRVCENESASRTNAIALHISTLNKEYCLHNKFYRNSRTLVTTIADAAAFSLLSAGGFVEVLYQS